MQFGAVLLLVLAGLHARLREVLWQRHRLSDDEEQAIVLEAEQQILEVLDYTETVDDAGAVMCQRRYTVTARVNPASSRRSETEASLRAEIDLALGQMEDEVDRMGRRKRGGNATLLLLAPSR